MGRVKVAIIGAGSFVFGPSALAGAILEHRMGDAELALVDVDRQVLDLMVGVGCRMARDAGLPTRLTAHADRAAALDGADFVLCSAAPGMQQRYAADLRLIEAHAPDHHVTEFGGIAGISYSLRQAAFILEVAADMRRLAPRAYLFDVANPLPRVCQVAHEAGVPTVGFCSASLTGYALLHRLLTGEGADYPFTAPCDAYDVTMAGLNHFSWIVAARARGTGEDLLPVLRGRLAAGASSGEPRTDDLARLTGYLPTPGDRHIADFLVPEGPPPPRRPMWHGDPQERQRRLALLRGVAEGTTPVDEVLRHGSWEKPMDLVAAMAYGRRAEFHALNLVNRGQIANLPQGVFVETPAVGLAGGPMPQAATIPGQVLPYLERAARVTDTIVRAAMERSRRLVHEAVDLDPTIVHKPAGRAAVDACLEAHADVLPRYT